jgi:peptide/nickel transport system substrate-binding protein
VTSRNYMKICLFLFCMFASMLSPLVYESVTAQIPTGGDLKIGLPDEIDNFNPYTRIMAASGSVVGLIYESLLRMDLKGVYHPGLAVNYTVSADGLTWRFILVRNATWHDGTKFTSKDVKFTFDIIINSTYTAKLDKYNLRDYIGSIETPSDYEVVFKLKKPWAPFLYYVGAFYSIVPQHVFSKVNITEFKNMENPIGTGPFKFKKYTPGASVELEANTAYWGGRPYVNRVIFVLYKSTSSMMLALQAGDVDTVSAVTIDPAIVPTFLKDPKIRVEILPGSIIRFLGFNLKRYPWSVREVREAIAYAIDKKAIVDTVMLGYADPAPDGWVPDYLGIWRNPAITYRPFNLTKANEILDKLGFLKGPDGIRVTPNGTKLSGTILTISGRAEFERTAELISGWLKQIGIDVKVLALSLGTVDEREGVGDFDLGLMGLGVPLEVDWHLFERFHSSASRPLGVYAPRNWMRYENPEMDQLLVAQREEMNLQKRIQIVYKIQEIIARDLPLLALYTKHSILAYRVDKFTGWGAGDVSTWGVTGATALRSVHLIPPPPVKEVEVPVPYIPMWVWGVIAILIVVSGASGFIAYRYRARKA